MLNGRNAASTQHVFRDSRSSTLLVLYTTTNSGSYIYITYNYIQPRFVESCFGQSRLNSVSPHGRSRNYRFSRLSNTAGETSRDWFLCRAKEPLLEASSRAIETEELPYRATTGNTVNAALPLEPSSSHRMGTWTRTLSLDITMEDPTVLTAVSHHVELRERPPVHASCATSLAIMPI